MIQLKSPNRRKWLFRLAFKPVSKVLTINSLEAGPSFPALSYALTWTLYSVFGFRLSSRNFLKRTFFKRMGVYWSLSVKYLILKPIQSDSVSLMACDFGLTAHSIVMLDESFCNSIRLLIRSELPVPIRSTSNKRMVSNFILETILWLKHLLDSRVYSEYKEDKGW